MRKKVLYLSHRIPYPPNKGDKIRSFNEIKHLSRTNSVDLITLADERADIKYETNLKKYCQKIKVFYLNKLQGKLNGFKTLLTGRSISQGYFYQDRVQKIFDAWVSGENYDAIICFSSPMAEYIFRSPKKITACLIMDYCDLDSDKWAQYAQKAWSPLRQIYKTEAVRLLDFEKKINQTFDRSVFVSQNEADLFKSFYPSARNMKVISNGVDQDYFYPNTNEHKTRYSSPMIMFPGAMDYHANIDGVLWFVREIWPLIKKKIPKIRFFIVGSNPAPSIKSLEVDPSITVTGFVEDIREYYSAADLCVIPLRIARGVQNKVLEAMAMGKPIVSTPSAVQGLNAESLNVVETADDPIDFSDKVIRLMENKNRAGSLGDAAVKFVAKNYNWSINLTDLY